MRNASLLILVGLLASLADRACGQNWPQFRGPTGDGLTSTSHPETWTAGENIAWKTKIPGLGWSQPIVWGDKIFVTAAVAEGQDRPQPSDWSPGDGLGGLTAFLGSLRKPPNQEFRWKVLCLDLSDGRVLWEQDAHVGRPTNPIHARNSYATETPATDGELVIASFGPAGLYCFDMTGKKLWEKQLGSYPMQMDWGTGSSPVLHEGLVMMQCDNDQQSFLAALDKKTGEEVWRVPREEKSNWCTPYLWRNRERTELVVGGGSKMRSYDPATGKLLWQIAGSGRCAPSPVGNAELLFVDSADRLTGQRGIMAAIRLGATGEIELPDEGAGNQFVAWTVKLTGNRAASPLLAGECLYLLDQMSGIIRCLDIATGKQHYRQRLPGAAGMTASPWSSGGKVFCLDQSGQTFVLAPGPELKVLAKSKLDDELFWSSPAIVGSTLLIRGIDHLYCIR